MLIKILKTIFVIGGIDFGLIIILFFAYGFARVLLIGDPDTDADLPDGWEDAFDFIFTILLGIFVICFGLAMSTAMSLLFNASMKAIWKIWKS